MGFNLMMNSRQKRVYMQTNESAVDALILRKS